MVPISKDFSLKGYNTFHLSARTKYFAEFDSDQSLIELLKAGKLPIFILGGGANILFTKDYDGMILHPISSKIIIDGETVIADAGVIWDRLVEFTIEKGLGGLENLSLIPGTVGAAPVQNIGAYGVEAKDLIKWVEYIGVDDKKLHRIENDDCHFGYRDSVFKHELKDKVVVVRVAFDLKKETGSYKYNVGYGSLQSQLGGLKLSIKNIRSAIISVRSSKLPDPEILGNAGSFFRNPEVTEQSLELIKSKYPDVVSYTLQNGNYKLSAGWMIEKTGWKGKSLGPAAVHDKQALVLVNKGGADGKDILALSNQIRHDVFQNFGVDLLPEVIII